MADRCTVHKLPVDKLEDAAGDPALAALMGEGWEVLASVVVDDGRGPSLHLLLRPPRLTTTSQGKAIPWWASALLGAGLTALGVALMALL
jgi:hypothetical protein